MAPAKPSDNTRRSEILDTAEFLIATRGLRTSLQEIASAAGILTGSLYHHFVSRDDLLLALVRRYHSDLADVSAAGLRRLDAHDSVTAEDKIIELGAAIAQCAVRNRAALQMSFYGAPFDNAELVELLRASPVSAVDAMVQTLRAGRWNGAVRPELDLPVLANRLCQSMLHVGFDVVRGDLPPAEVATALCRIMLKGLVFDPPADDGLDESAALRAAQQVIDTWTDNQTAVAGLNAKAAHIRRTALTVFGRKGFEVTTIRDIAAAASLNAATVYRIIGSKEDLLASIMRDFGAKTVTASVAAMDAPATPVQKLDALSWIFINAVAQFPDEWKIQLAWMRQSPPGTPNPGYAFGERMQQLRELLTAGIDSGDLRGHGISRDLLTRCVMDVLWVPEDIIRDTGIRGALTLARETVFRGVSQRRDLSAGTVGPLQK